MAAPDGIPPIEALVPHRGPALWIRSVLAVGEDRLECLGWIPPDHAYARSGAAPCFVGLELAAQAAAALEALGHRRDDRDAAPRIGYIVGIREARFEVASLPAGQELRAQARLLGGASALAVHELLLFHGEIRCLSAQVSTYRAGRTPAALKGAR